MNLLIEGPDCSGKSTLIQTVLSDFCIIHNGVYKSPDLAFKAYMDQIPSNYSAIVCPLIVWDRQYVSEQIYGPIFRGKGLSQEQVEAIEAKHRALNTIVVLCNPPKDVVMQQWRLRNAKREEYIEQESYFDKIVDEYYENFATHCSLPFIEFNYLDDDLMDVKRRVLNMRTQIYKSQIEQGR